jgi:hypothetical protein
MNSDKNIFATSARLTVSATFPTLLVVARSIYVSRPVNPIDHWRTWAMSLLFASLLIFAYWLFHDLERG